MNPTFLDIELKQIMRDFLEQESNRTKQTHPMMSGFTVRDTEREQWLDRLWAHMNTKLKEHADH